MNEVLARILCAFGYHRYGAYTPWRSAGTDANGQEGRRRERRCACGAVAYEFDGPPEVLNRHFEAFGIKTRLSATQPNDVIPPKRD